MPRCTPLPCAACAAPARSPRHCCSPACGPRTRRPSVRAPAPAAQAHRSPARTPPANASPPPRSRQLGHARGAAGAAVRAERRVRSRLRPRRVAARARGALPVQQPPRRQRLLLAGAVDARRGGCAARRHRHRRNLNQPRRTCDARSDAFRALLVRACASGRPDAGHARCAASAWQRAGSRAARSTSWTARRWWPGRAAPGWVTSTSPRRSHPRCWRRGPWRSTGWRARAAPT